MRGSFFVVISGELLFDRGHVAAPAAIRDHVLLHYWLVKGKLLLGVVAALANHFGGLTLADQSAHDHAIVKTFL